MNSINYGQTITTILKTLHKKFPNDSFCVEVVRWYFNATSKLNDIKYRIYRSSNHTSFESNVSFKRALDDLMEANRKVEKYESTIR